MRHRLLAALLLVGVAAPLAAQTESNAYLPVASWTTPYVEHLIRAGVLNGLDPLTRPLRRADVARAVAAVDTDAVAESVRGTLRLLARELDERADTVRWKLEANVAALGASDASRWTFRPAGQAPRLFIEGGLEASLEFPHVAMVTHPFFDTRLIRDPQFAGKKGPTAIAGENAGAYVMGSWKYFDVFFGIEPRNWGPPEVEGLILSTSPYPYDHLLLRLGPRRFRLEMLATQLDNLPAWDSGDLRKRFLSAHRLVLIPSERLAISLSESAVYANAGEPDRFFEPWFLNPVNLWVLPNFNHIKAVNTLWAGDVSYRPRNGVRLATQVYIDDIQVNNIRGSMNKPAEWGYTFVATGGGLRGGLSWSALYTKVDNLDYRTTANEEQYTLYGVGLARDHDDYDQWTARATVAPAPRALLTGEFTLLRQGEGDIRKRIPVDPTWAAVQGFLTGVVERTFRLAAQASWTPLDGVNLSADIGRHFLHNAGHLSGARSGRWVWRVRAEIRRRLTGALRW
jgi:hypothetical protein